VFKGAEDVRALDSAANVICTDAGTVAFFIDFTEVIVNECTVRLGQDSLINSVVTRKLFAKK
jgi:hypothetical protein